MKFSEKVDKVLKKNFLTPNDMIKFVEKPVRLVFNKSNPQHKECLNSLDIIEKIQRLKSKMIN